ncbi:carbohydrate ABC transporter permease [Deinococcus planocerae]|uniref:carbohydrate ABC transporter permease n=1 Tax=Deinococcus planocerae TaxID=1737569 RepID=UPI000C7F5049|nr:carbohydrate ABC transporter permease [Deinococcus planocerae]
MRRKGRAAQFGWDLVTLLAAALFLLPVLWVVMSSFRPSPDVLGGPLLPTRLTLENYGSLARNAPFVTALQNSLLVGLCSALGALMLAVPTAYALTRLRFRGRELVGTLVLLTQMIPGIVIVIPLVVMMRSLGLTNSALGLILVHVVVSLPITVWLLRNYVEDVPVALEEAALVDGCTRLQSVSLVLLPLLYPAVAAVGTFAFVLSWGEYLLALSLTTTADHRTLPLAVQGLFSQFRQDWGLIMAGGVVIALPVALLFLLIRRFLVDGLVSGGVKG